MKRTARKVHRRIWLVLGLVLPLLVIGLLAIRQSPQPDYQPQQIEPPGEN